MLLPLVLVSVLSVGPAQARAHQDELAIVRGWIADVLDHQPGVIDKPLLDVATQSPESLNIVRRQIRDTALLLGESQAGRALVIVFSDGVEVTSYLDASAVLDTAKRYLLSYTPRGVKLGGWHRLQVRVKQAGAMVKARPGYLGG